MSTNPTTFPAPFSTAHLSDPVRARVAVNLQLTNDQIHQSEGHSTIHTLPETAKGLRRLHPGDVAYWAACVGGACLLLIFATR